MRRYRNLVVLRAAHRRCTRRVGRLDDHLVTDHGLHPVDEVRRVERDDEVFAAVVPVHRLRRVAHVLALHREVDPPAAHGQAHRGRVVAHEKLHPAQSSEEILLPEVEPVRVVVGDQLFVVRVAAFEQARADLDVALPERDLVRARGDADPIGVGPLGDRPRRQALELRERPGRHQQILLTRDGVGPGQVPHGHAVRVGRHHAQRPVDPRDQDTGEQRPAVVV